MVFRIQNDDAEDHDTEDADVEEEDRSKDRAARFVRACTVDMHLEISQEPVYTEIYKENATPQEPDTLCASQRNRNGV